MYKIRQGEKSDIEAIVKVYNSNIKFLANHLGVESVDSKFIFEEMQEMKGMGFVSCVIVGPSTDAIVGVLDYKPDNTVYLSLIMIDLEHQKCGTGGAVYKQFEQDMKRRGKAAIRIDVVNDYTGNVVGFWEKQGFIPKDEIQLSWGQKQSTAVVMTKNLE